jgi:hypothetical protein
MLSQARVWTRGDCSTTWATPASPYGALYGNVAGALQGHLAMSTSNIWIDQNFTVITHYLTEFLLDRLRNFQGANLRIFSNCPNFRM